MIIVIVITTMIVKFLNRIETLQKLCLKDDVIWTKKIFLFNSLFFDLYYLFFLRNLTIRNFRSNKIICIINFVVSDIKE